MDGKPLSRSGLIAPCGMNCGICIAHLREKNKCPGCRGPDEGKPATRLVCRIKTCDKQKRFCFSCREYPCARLLHLDRRYRAKYHMSMIENLESIREKGLRFFLENEKRRWSCPCGGTVCVHTGACSRCSKTFL